jgi:hypothetical protein
MPKKPKSKRLRHPTGSVPTATLDGTVRPALPPVLIEGRWYARTRRASHEAVVVPEIAASADQAAVPERLVPFMGAAVTTTITVASVNRFFDSEATGTPSLVGGLIGYLITLDATPVYSPSAGFPTILDALADAARAVRLLLHHPVRWQTPTYWLDRPIYYLGIPATIRGFDANRGEVLVEAEAGWSFPPSALAREVGLDDAAPTSVRVDLLSDQLVWFRTAMSPDPEAAQNDEG